MSLFTHFPQALVHHHSLFYLDNARRLQLDTKKHLTGLMTKAQSHDVILHCTAIQPWHTSDLQSSIHAHCRDVDIATTQVVHSFLKFALMPLVFGTLL
jgi:hypothetical protein